MNLDANQTAPPGTLPDTRPWFMRHRMRSFFLLLLTVILIGIISATTAYTVYVNKLKRSEPYAMAVERVRDDLGVQHYLGRPIEPMWLAQGLIKDQEGVGEFVFRVQGPTGKGTVRVKVERGDSDSPWRIVFLDVAAFSDFGVDVVTLVNEKPPAPGNNLPTPTDEAKEKHGVE